MNIQAYSYWFLCQVSGQQQQLNPVLVGAEDDVIVDYIRFPLTETGFVYSLENGGYSISQSEMDQNISNNQVLHVQKVTSIFWEFIMKIRANFLDGH